MSQVYYTSIEDLPIWNWNKIHEKGDYTYLRLHRINSQNTKKEHAEMKLIWENMFEEYVQHFGFSKNFLDQLEKRKQIAFYQLEFIETGDTSLQTLIEITQRELKSLQVTDGKPAFWKTKALVEQLVRFQLDVKTTTVIEFYSHIEKLKQDGKLT